MKAALRVWQINYCQSEYTRCARYQLACAGKRMPSTLLPNGKTLALEPAAATGKAK